MRIMGRIATFVVVTVVSLALASPAWADRGGVPHCPCHCYVITSYVGGPTTITCYRAPHWR